MRPLVSILAGSIFFATCCEALSNLGWDTCSTSYKCSRCMGDCDSDNDCQDGLSCFQRNGYATVPGCSSGGSGDVASMDYCARTRSSSSTSPGPQEFWQITSGKSYCEIVDDGRCVTDGDGFYGNNEYCEVVALRPLTVSTNQFNVESCASCDYVSINNVRYTYATGGPREVGMRTGDTLKWVTDHSRTRTGFKICGSSLSTSPVSFPSTSPGSSPSTSTRTATTSSTASHMYSPTSDNKQQAQQEFWQITSGKSYCEIVDDGRCVTDGDDIYGNNEYCEVVALQSLVMSAKYYKVEAFSDYVTVNGVEYSSEGSEGPDQVHMKKDDKWTWKSDQSVQYNGFKICADKADDPKHIPAIVVAIVVSIVILAVVTVVVLKASATQRARTTQTPTVHRTMTPVAITAETSVSNVPMATETGIRSSLTVDAEMFMPSVPSSEIVQNFDNIPVATAAPAVDTVNTSVAASQHTENPANMPVAVARDPAESGDLPVVATPSV